MQNILLLESALLDWFHCVEQSVHLPSVSGPQWACDSPCSVSSWRTPFSCDTFCIIPTSQS